jgi:hypothetical protein
MNAAERLFLQEWCRTDDCRRDHERCRRAMDFYLHFRQRRRLEPRLGPLLSSC